ncbi:MAG: MoaD/ThiS family protein [Candidatus Hydrothermarchaeota archaeon]
MKIKVKRVGKEEELSLKDGSTIMDVLNILNINPVTVVVSLNGRIRPEEEKLNDGDILEIINVISGG